MAFQFESPYAKQIEERMKNVFDSLSEKDRRRYAAIEAEKLGMVVSVTSQSYWVVPSKRSGMDRMSCNRFPRIPWAIDNGPRVEEESG